MCHTHAREYYSGLKVKKKKKEILTHATWVNFEDSGLSEISQSPKDKDCMIPLM